MDNAFRIYPIGIQNFDQPDHRKVMKVGVNFDSATRTIGEWIAMED
jgi:hypothetical protein